jgi:hypothetical protein
MDLDSVLKSRLAQENQASNQIQEAIHAMRSDVEKSNEKIAERLRPKESDRYKDREQPEAEKEPEEQKIYKTESVPVFKKSLVYFSFGYEMPPWVSPLEHILTQSDYFVYNPAKRISEQFSQEDIEGINALEKKLVKPLCSTLGLNENILHPFEIVAKILNQGDLGDSFASVFKAQWFLTRSSVVVSDLSFAGSEELFLARQLGIPSIGMFPPSGQITPWQHQNCTVLYTPQNLQYLVQIIRGFI